MKIALPLVAMMQAAPATPPPPAPVTPAIASRLDPSRLDQCIETAQNDPETGIATANSWLAEAPGLEPRQCLGAAFYFAERFPAALSILIETASAADGARSPRRGEIWGLAGLAALGAGDAAAARDHFTRAIEAGTLANTALGGTLAQRARAAVMAGDLAAARADLDRAVVAAPQNGSIWLLSATLARRMADGPRAQADVQQAAALSPRDPAVALEAGNIAYLADNFAAARRSWESAIAIAPQSAIAASARRRIADMETELATAPR
jgi:tetratricopeptide (TPR) repeat protein